MDPKTPNPSMVIAMKQLMKMLTLAVVFCGASFSRAQEVASKPKEPVATITTGWTYLWADQGAHYRANLNGWFLRPAINLPHGYSIFFDSTNYYGRNAKGSVNSHGFTAGVAKSVFPHPHFKPSIFAESGDVRASSAGTITNQLAINVGGSFTVPLARWISLAVTPAEYIFLYPKSDWRNDYNAKVGFSFPIGHR
jgi:hypothetical protein